MNDHDRQRLIQDYLNRLARELEDVPAGARRELLEDVRSHIEEAWAASAEQSRAALLNIFERLGTPEALACEERERLGLGESPVPKGPGILEVAAIALTLLAWPVGVLLAWLSPRWLTRDKVVATLVPALGLLVAVSMMAVGQASFSAAPVVTRVVEAERPAAGQGPQPEPGVAPSASPTAPTPSGPDRGGVQALLLRVLVFAGMLGGPFITALYLALRMRPHPRRAGTVMLAVAAVLALCIVVALFLMPATSRVSGVTGEPHAASVQVQVGDKETP